jgi:hypothetical protein
MALADGAFSAGKAPSADVLASVAAMTDDAINAVLAPYRVDKLSRLVRAQADAQTRATMLTGKITELNSL